MDQFNLFQFEKPKPTGEILRDRGIKKALNHAEDVHDQWQKKALDFLYLYALKHDRFSGEMVRMEAKGIVEDPPSLRAWGGILLAGAKRGWIRRVGYILTENPKSHRTPATEWESCL